MSSEPFNITLRAAVIIHKSAFFLDHISHFAFNVKVLSQLV